MNAAYIYPVGLALISLLLIGLERLWPWRKEQRQLRPGLWSDVIHLVFNGHFLGVILYTVAMRHVLPPIDHWLGARGWIGHVYRNAAVMWPVWLQIPVCLLAVDFLQWCVHNLLHRVSWLWRFHQVHHSVVDGEMDFWVSFRFHWFEVVVYKTVLYLPLAWLGFGQVAILTHALFGTLIGHLNHANLDWSYGPLRYVLNNPRMHLWHHHDEQGVSPQINFGIIFSLWDYLFRTAHVPAQPPRRLGFPGVEAVPRTFFSHAVWPIDAILPAAWPHAALTAGLGVVFIGVASWRYLPYFPTSSHGHGAVATPLLGETIASTQPVQGMADASAYAQSATEADQALGHFGDDARVQGYAHPETMVSVRELARALQSPRLRLIDVRPEERFMRGRIPGAQPIWIPDYSESKPIPGMSRSREQLEALLRRRGVRKDSVVVLYGDGEPEVYRLWWTLRLVGGYETAVLDGGLPRWKAEGHAVVQGPRRPVVAGDVVLAGPAVPPPLRWSEIQTLLTASTTTRDGAADRPVLLDTRTLAEYQGDVKHPKAARAGRIPGAQHLDWMRILRGDADPRLRPVGELKALLSAYAPTPQTRVVTSCQTGTRSSVVYFALYQLGHDQRRLFNYNGSWAEYSRLDLPVARGPADAAEPERLGAPATAIP